MTDQDQVPQTTGGNAQEGSTANIVYILYIVSVLVGITALVGVIIAYVNRGDAPEWVKSHYTFQIRTFWIMLVGSIVGGILIAALGIGLLVLLVLLIWMIVRCVKGMKWISAGTAVPDPNSWIFGQAK